MKVFTFEGNCDIIVIESKKAEKYYNAIKNFETVFGISTILLKGH